MRLVKSICMAVSLLCFALPFAAAQAAGPDPVYTGFFSKLAIGGYDAVAYFTEGRPVEGSKAFTSAYKGAQWRFSSAANQAKFDADPTAYAPQYGGYCAYAVAQGDTVSARPELWTIHRGKLYLNYSRDVNQTWRADMEAYIEQADANWPELLEDN